MTTSVPAARVEPREIRLESHRFDLAALDYSDPPRGGASDRPPMLLVHGMRDLAWSMDSIAQAFAERYRVISIDLRGHGDSGQPGYYALPHFVADIHTVIRSLDLERPILVGHSFGGEVVSQFAGTFPEVPSACVLIEGLGPPPWEGEGSELIRKQMARTSVEDIHQIDPAGRRVQDLETAVSRLGEVHPKLSPERARFLAQKGTRPHAAGGLRWKWDPMLRTMFGSFSRDIMEERWTWVESPVLVVMGGESGTWWNRGRRGAGARTEATASGSYLPPSELERRLALFDDASCVEIASAGHMVHFDTPDELNRTIATFLDQRA